MLKHFSLIFLVLFTSTGCETFIKVFHIYDANDSHNRVVNGFMDSMELYCNVNGFKDCIFYRQCIFNKYKSIEKLDVKTYDRLVNIHLPSLYKKDEYIFLLDGLYNELVFYGEDFKYEKIYFRDYSRMKVFRLGGVFYAHNSCASIIGDKTYNIDEYILLISSG